MGVVYEARQLSLNRKVALKVLSGGLGLTPKAIERFRREAEAAAKLHHTNIVPVYATGEQDGAHFYAMELIDGPSLDQVIQQRRDAGSGRRFSGAVSPVAATPRGFAGITTADTSAATRREAPTPAPVAASSRLSERHDFDNIARMMAEVADALEYAHEQGVIHRDIKPSNLLLAPDGRLSINDFGLARMLEQPGMTVTGEFVGTPAYMSPEQVRADRPVDRRSDIYSLGATLYELLTLEPPFTATRRDQVLTQILQVDPRPPRTVNRKVPVDLDTICLKAIEKNPDRRYQTAGAMAEDLRRYARRFAIAARRAGPVERLRKWVRRHPTAAVSLLGSVLTLGIAGFFAYQSHRAEEERLADQRRHDEQLRAERRQRSLDDAIAAALGGNLDTAEQAIRAAELQGASPGQVRLLRGLVYLQRSDVKPAIEDLEQAARLLPNSVAVRALLAIFHLRVYQMAQVWQLEEELAGMEPQTPEDFLFKGYLLSVRNPEVGLPALDEAVRRRDTAVARAIRAEARADFALERSDLATALAAQEDARVARALLAANPFALTASARAHLAAAILYREQGDAVLSRAAFAEMERPVRELSQFERYPGAGFYRSVYFAQTGDAATASEVLRQTAERCGENRDLVSYASDLYERGDIEAALQVLARRKDSDDWGGDLLRAFLLAERKDNGPAQAYDAAKQWMARYSTNGEFATLAASLLLFLGHKAEAQSLVRDQSLPVGLNPARHEFSIRYRAYVAGDSAGEEELLQAAEGSRTRQASAHHILGMMNLADGRRAAAQRHFRRAVQNQTFNLFIEIISPVMATRLEKDPTWPLWIPVNE